MTQRKREIEALWRLAAVVYFILFSALVAPPVIDATIDYLVTNGVRPGYLVYLAGLAIVFLVRLWAEYRRP